LPQPIPLAAVSIAPEGPPLSFTYQGQVERIQRHWGPERIETAWWRGPSVRRDYYRVEVAAGRRFWLFRELRTGRWFLHGHFD
jgi:protein ImuB